MSWERRRGRLYFYRKWRTGNRVRSEYMGAGLVAQMAAAADDNQRRNRAVQSAAAHAVRQAEAQIDQQLAGVESAIAAMTHVALLAAGFHKHKGQWRKKRHE